jgi:hypothetical protein
MERVQPELAIFAEPPVALSTCQKYRELHEKKIPTYKEPESFRTDFIKIQKNPTKFKKSYKC